VLLTRGDEGSVVSRNRFLARNRPDQQPEYRIVNYNVVAGRAAISRSTARHNAAGIWVYPWTGHSNNISRFFIAY
jgi:hypothetical protein